LLLAAATTGGHGAYNGEQSVQPSEALAPPDEWWDDLYADPTRNFGGWATSIRSTEETAAMQRDLVRLVALPLLALWLLLLVVLHVLEV
jgi:hypothetical protein